MKIQQWRKHHKWFGLICALFLMAFCISGIILNHRAVFADCEVSRGLLPSRYHYQNWNNGLLRGTISTNDGCLVFGTSGIWRRETDGSFGDFNKGLPEAADFRNVRRIVQSSDSTLYAATTDALYRLSEGKGWQRISVSLDEHERITDIEIKGDSIVLLGRSNLYTAVHPHSDFKKIRLASSHDSKGEVTLFRTVWTIHSGEAFGLPGRLFVDLIALIFIVLTVTGLIIWFMPHLIRRRHSAAKSLAGTLKFNIIWHNKIGRLSIALTLLLAVTGWCLRPPVMIPLALTKTAPIPGSTLDSDNPWNERLRAIRYDAEYDDYILSTSDGFFRLGSLTSAPERLGDTPPISVMGINVWERAEDGRWICGSFSGMYYWNRSQGVCTDWFTGAVADSKPGPPFGKRAVAGYSADLADAPFAVEYNDGTDAIAQPDALSKLPMSLWNLALEIHSGRIFIGQIATYVFVFILGLAIVWCLVSGYRLRRR